jgi:hypothetical protein
MISAIALLPFLAAAVYGQTSLIPTNVSEGCAAYLKTLNEDTSLQPCTKALIDGTAPYSSGSSVTAEGVTSTLTALCNSSACNAGALRSALSKFAVACNEELTTKKNDDVIRTYDVLYSVQPLKEAICAKDDDGSWCLPKVTANIADADKSAIQSTLSKRAPAVSPNVGTYCSTNLAFLFVKPSWSEANLCTTCTKNILTSYINFESTLPYAPGLDSSALLCGQTELYQGITNTCGASFLQSQVQAAGGIASGIGGDSKAANAAGRSSGVAISGVVVVMSALALLN